MKRSRPLSLFLSVLFLIFLFPVVSLGASDNLIDSDLRNWESYYSTGTTVAYAGSSYIIFSSPDLLSSGGYLHYTLLYDMSDLISGRSYTFSFDLLDLAQVNEINPDIKEHHIYGGLLNGSGYYVFGLGSINSEGIITADENSCIKVDKDNYLDYFGKTNTITFEMPNMINPCIIVAYYDVSDYSGTVYTYINALKLIDNNQAEEDGFFDRLFQFFHDLKWEIVGGSCGDSDCSKSPHTSLADKFSVKFQEGLDNLKQFFHDLKWEIVGGSCGDNDCSKSPHTSLADKVVNGLSDFFRGFGNLILYFNWDGEYTNPFEREDSPIDKVSEFFDDLIEYVDSIGTSIENILDSITGGLHIFDEFTSRFPWLKGIAMFCLAIIVLSRFIGL